MAQDLSCTPTSSPLHRDGSCLGEMQYPLMGSCAIATLPGLSHTKLPVLAPRPLMPRALDCGRPIHGCPHWQLIISQVCLSLWCTKGKLRLSPIGQQLWTPGQDLLGCSFEACVSPAGSGSSGWGHGEKARPRQGFFLILEMRLPGKESVTQGHQTGR